MNAFIRTMRPVLGVVRVLVPALFLLLGVLAAMALFSAKPTPLRVERSEVTTAVRTIQVHDATVRLDVEAWGEVTARRTLSLQPQVSGRLIEIQDGLAPGSLFKAGTVVARIDPRDYELALQQAEAGLDTAKFKLELEEGRSRIAKRDWELLGDVAGELVLDAQSSQLALRQPHLREAQSVVETARTTVELAALALERTQLVLPFDAMVLSRSGVDGTFVGPTSVIATLVGTGAWWVEVGVPLDDLARVTLPDAAGNGGGEAQVHVRLGDGVSAHYIARIVRLMGTVDAAGRQARVLLEVDDPLGQSRTQPVPLLLGSYVRATLEGPARQGVFELPRSVLRDGDDIWVLGTDSRLSIRRATVLHGSLDKVVVDMDLREGERIIASAVPTPVPGLLLVDETRR